MRFSLQLPTDRVDAGEEFTSGAAVAEMARAIEAAGFHACFVTEHPFPPERWLESGGHHALEPYVALSFAAAATTRLRLQTNIAVLPYRSPFLTAKAAASLDVLSGGRLILGVAAGYLKGEFAALGADFEARNSRSDEAIAAMRRAWSGDPVSLASEAFQARDNRMLPRPLQRPGPPIWVGGNSRRAIRRAAELGDGWIPFPTLGLSSQRIRTAEIRSLDDLAERTGYLRDCAREIGRETPLDICFPPLGLPLHRPDRIEAGQLRDTLAELAALGVTWTSLSLPARTRSGFCDAVRRFGDELLAKLEPDGEA
jgi:probable F420-dependent oxidoreductase